jgi:uncharacterized protein (TIGR02117 family)
METRPAAAREASVTIHVVSHGWHTGIVVRRADVALGAWPEVDDFARAEYLEVGWGDRAYYQKLDPGVGDALAAVLVPGPSVLHIVGFRGPVRQVFPASEVIALSITPGQLAELLAFVRSAYARDASGRPLPLGPGLYGDSRFYAAVERFHLFHNCNVWTARALQAAGVPVGSDLTAGGVMSEVRRVAAGRGAP